MLAIDFRGFGESRAEAKAEPAHHLDVLAAVHYLQKEGATTVAVIGASFGGVAAATAAIEEPGSSGSYCWVQRPNRRTRS